MTLLKPSTSLTFTLSDPAWGAFKSLVYINGNLKKKEPFVTCVTYLYRK